MTAVVTSMMVLAMVGVLLVVVRGTGLSVAGEHAEADEKVGENHCEEEDEEDEYCVECCCGHCVGRGYGEVCRKDSGQSWLRQWMDWRTASQVVRTIISSVPDTSVPILFRLIRGSLEWKNPGAGALMLFLAVGRR